MTSIESVIAGLIDERRGCQQRIDQIDMALYALKPLVDGRKMPRNRPRLSEEQRQAQAQRMRDRWAAVLARGEKRLGHMESPQAATA